MPSLLAPGLRAPAAALVALFLAPLLAEPAGAELAVPPLEARVTDRADLLSPQEERALEQRLAAFEEETTHQVAVLTVESLEGEAVASYALRVVESWELGRADVDNGALFLVSAGDRRMRIEVGYGLEGALPDAVASRIIRDVVAPRFRAGEMGAGIVAGTEAILGSIRGEEVPAPPGRRRAPRGGARDTFSLALFCAFGGGMVGAAIGRKRRAAGAAVGAGLAAGLAYLLASSVGVSAIAGLLGALFGVGGPVGGGRFGPVFLPGGLGGRGGFGVGGFGGGGFGGGGGGFGGGGASGSW